MAQSISGVSSGGEGRVPPPTSDPEISAGKKEARKKWKRGKMESKRRENCKRESEKLKMEGGKSSAEGGEDLFFFFFFFWLFAFQNDEHLFWVYQNGNFVPGKRISRRKKNQEK